MRGDGVPAALRAAWGVPSHEARLHPDVHPSPLLDNRLGGWLHVGEVCPVSVIVFRCFACDERMSETLSVN